MYHLFLDDMRKPGDVNWIRIPSASYIVVKNYDEFVRYISVYGVPIHVSFDHDLADLHYGGNYGDERSGYDCAKWLADYCHDNGRKLPTYTVHSMNPEGIKRITAYLENAKKHWNI